MPLYSNLSEVERNFRFFLPDGFQAGDDVLRLQDAEDALAAARAVVSEIVVDLFTTPPDAATDAGKVAADAVVKVATADLMMTLASARPGLLELAREWAERAATALENVRGMAGVTPGSGTTASAGFRPPSRSTEAQIVW